MTHVASDRQGVSSTELRGAMGRFATGVTVVTSVDDRGAPVGTTASAVSSLSLDPPLVLVCLDRRSRTLTAVRDRGTFAVNVLGTHHEDVSNAFARSANAGAWSGVDHVTRATGSPVFGDAHVALDCEVERLADGGDHEIVIGRVVDLAHDDGDAEPLLFYGGRYAGVAGPSARELEAAQARGEAAELAVEASLPTGLGEFRILAHERRNGDITVALVHGDPASHPRPAVRWHAACLVGDVFGSLGCGCRAGLAGAVQAITETGAGVLLYTKPAGAAALSCAANAPVDEPAGLGLLDRAGLAHHGRPAN